MPPLRIAVVVVGWNTREHVRTCLTRLGSTAAPAVVYVDNASSDGSAEMVEREFPQVEVLHNERNLGFARACNRGIETALAGGAAFVALVNSDVVVAPNILEELCRFVAETPGAAAASPALRHPDGRLQSGAAGYRPSAWNGVCHFLFLSSLTRGRCRGVFVQQSWFEGTLQPVLVDWVSGACVVVAAEAIRRGGLLDERFFLYGEDVDWFSRMSGAGASVWYLPWLTAQHWQGASSSGGERDTRWLAALCDLVHERSGAIPAVIFRLSAGLGLAIRSLLQFAAWGIWRDRFHRERAAELAAYAAWALRPMGSTGVRSSTALRQSGRG